ncbi:MAG: dihydropteroate synthase, partial [Betaproteobacteria bacterium]|nr:dihydropteroate synthase [Betaproteobacteria bacterium]
MATPDQPAESPPVFICGRYRLALNRPLIMGIVNVTPDSFSGDGMLLSSGAKATQQAIAYAERLAHQGADLLDIGGESTRPGAAAISEQQEIDRIGPVLDSVLRLGLPISVDTRRPAVMRAVIAQGVDLINDVNGFRDPQAMDAVSQSGCGLCIMHMQGEPATMQAAPAYQDVVAEVEAFLLAQRQQLIDRGVLRERILIDPGFGFGKTLHHNLQLMQAISRFSNHQPVLVGVSRKSMIGVLTGESRASERVSGSVAAA